MAIGQGNKGQAFIAYILPCFNFQLFSQDGEAVLGKVGMGVNC